jgi:hypothetical protein
MVPKDIVLGGTWVVLGFIPNPPAFGTLMGEHWDTNVGSPLGPMLGGSWDFPTVPAIWEAFGLSIGRVIREHDGVPLTWCREYPKTSDGAVPKHVGRQLGSHSAKMLEYYKCGHFFNICVHMHL